MADDSDSEREQSRTPSEETASVVRENSASDDTSLPDIEISASSLQNPTDNTVSDDDSGSLKSPAKRRRTASDDAEEEANGIDDDVEASSRRKRRVVIDDDE